MEVFTPEDTARMKEHEAFFNVADNLRSARLDFDHEIDDEYLTDDQRILEDDLPLVYANATSSVVREGKDMFGYWPAPGKSRHKPVLDIDVSHLYVPSTTPGHAHLIINKPLSWEDYEELLRVLGKCGILEEGYVSASIERKCTWIRTPWTKKDKKHDTL